MKTKLLLLLMLLPICAGAQTYTYSTFYTFKTGTSASLSLMDGSGNLYGLSSGGTHNAGEVYKITPKKGFTTLYSFTTSEGTPGSLIRSASNGNFYGIYGGTGSGGVYKLTNKNGKYTYSVLYTDPDFGFYGSGGGVALDSKGDIYGAADFCTSSGYLCMFEIPTDGEWTDLLDICCEGEDLVTSNVILDKNGSVYAGIGYEGISGFGWVQESLGNEYSCCSSDVSSLRQDSAGDIYISEYGNDGGATDYGTIQKLTVSTGVLATLYAFCTQPNCPDGAYPGNLTLDSKGNIFGTNSAGVFKLTTAGVESLIYSGAVGAGLVMDSAGNLYGTQTGGANGSGSIYKLNKN
jgi:uncharacterized repeat protein (TIGR03803 family)